MGDAPVGDHHVHAGGGGDAGGLDLGAHAASRKLGRRAARDRLDGGRNTFDDGRELRMRVAVAAGPIKSFNVGEQDQEIRARHRRHPRRQAIVVAVADFAGRNRVVLVDDRDRAHRQEPRQRLAGVEIAAALFGVLQGQQDLAGDDAVASERPPPGARQRDLADRRRGLAVFEFQCSLSQAERSCGRARWPRTTRRARSRHARRSAARSRIKRLEPGLLERAERAVDQERRADFDDDAVEPVESGKFGHELRMQ